MASIPRHVPWSVQALDNEICQHSQPVGTRPQRLQAGMRLGVQIGSQCACALQTQQRHIGGLVLRLVLAGRLAQRGRIRGHVQDVVPPPEGRSPDPQ